MIFGAFGAHALRDSLSTANMAIFITGTHYHQLHALAALVTAALADRFDFKPGRIAATLFLVGILVFSGSLYLLAITDTRWLGAITPLGGACFILGWLWLAIPARKKEVSSA